VTCFLFRRYFSFRQPKSSVELVPDAVTNQHLLAAHKLLEENNTKDALEALERGLDSNAEEVWLKYAMLKCEVSSGTDLDSLHDIFAKAISSTRSYVVMLEVK